MENLITYKDTTSIPNTHITTRIAWLDQLRAIAMLLVVLGHCALPKDSVKYIYSFHMPLFFMISGMTFRASKFTSLISLIKDKWRKLIVPHLIMNFLMLPLWIYTFKILSTSKPNLITLLKGIFYINSGRFQSPSNATWFLAALFIVEILFYLIYKFAKGDYRFLTISVIICGIIGFIESTNPSNYDGPWHIEACFTAIVFYMLGFYTRKYLPILQFKLHTNKSYILTALILLFIGSYFSINNGRISFNGNSYDSILYFYISSISISLSIIMLVIKMPNIEILNYIGKNTLLYVGIHIPLIRIFENLYPIFKTNYKFAFVLGIFVYFIMLPIIYLINGLFPFICGKKQIPSIRNNAFYKLFLYSIGTLYILIIFKLMPYVL